MKKTFVEPKFKRIEMNLKENIAYSGDKYPASGNTFLTFYLNAESEPVCNIIATGIFTSTVTKDDIQFGKLADCFDLGSGYREGATSVSRVMNLS